MQTKTLMFSFLAVVLLFMTSTVRAKDEKLKPEQVIARHLESIGPADKLKDVKSRGTAGTAQVDIHVGGQANMTGEGNLMSQGSSVRLSLRYPSLGYPGEQFGYDGK
ncbi:MAG TPA: hypothetical protein VKY31_14000, partial [Terriglobia bacterium]|nr:hypothetical protein [Terriglobia bacterium]